MSRCYDVVHRTRYSYDDDVTPSYGRAYLLPRTAPGQQVLASQLMVAPEPVTVSESRDHFGNRATYLEITRPHRRLDVVATSRVSLDRPLLPVAEAHLSCADAVAALADPGGGDVDLLARELVLPSPQVRFDAAVHGFASSVLGPSRAVGPAVLDLVARIHAEFAYVPGSTSVTTTLTQVLQQRRGVCQDFAHLAVGCLRSVGLPARYVSGYLETSPPPGRPKLQGADASHAWVSVLLPDLGWVDLDPTNNQVVDDGYVVTAWGRDYTDVPPLKGVIVTEGRTVGLEVAVDVTPVTDLVPPVDVASSGVAPTSAQELS
jgi:transglutaminase-like putative cysteine protease